MHVTVLSPGGVGIAASATRIAVLIAQEGVLATAARFCIFSSVKSIEQPIK